MAPRETENNAYAKFRGDEQRTLWYVMVFSGVVNWKLFMFYLKIVSSYSGSIESAALTISSRAYSLVYRASRAWLSLICKEK